MEGMVLVEMLQVQQQYIDLMTSPWTLADWLKGLVVKLLEITHGQWLYWDIHVHGLGAGMHAIDQKEEIR